MIMIRKRVIIISIIIILVLSLFLGDKGITGFFSLNNACIEKNISLEILFCPSDNCYERVIQLFSSSEKAYCAFYDLDYEIYKVIEEATNLSLLIDEDNCINEYNSECIYGSGLMHNKFCIFDNEVVLTGSLNPTENGFFKNNNNIVIINSSCLADAYLDEFHKISKLDNSSSGLNEINEFNKIIVNGQEIIEFYFCPEDNCRKEVLDTLKNAEHNICIAAFALTDDALSDELIELSSSGINVYGTIESRNVNLLGSKVSMLEGQGNIALRLDSNEANMHNKFFVIDNKSVITGSANPSKNGYENNDENVLIIHNEEIAKAYLDECNRIFQSARASVK
ncbi:MAG: hypothetical protein PWR30_193 [Candidatus Woesearchaeota archaeon]|nr:hypothetical protein [Candidatus Woesearchaeota archaeon]